MLWPGRSKHSTLNDAALGTKPKAARSQHPLAGGDARRATPDRSHGHATPCGRTPTISTGGNATNSTGSRRPTRNSGAPTSSKKDSATCSPPKGEEGKEALDRWLSWARRSQLESFIHLAKRITKHRHAIDGNLEHGLSQGLIESTNTKIRLLTRIAFGFHGPQPVIALALLALGSHPPRLPGRT
jgi:hypothetical protein